MTVLSSAGETSSQRTSRRHAILQSKWVELVEASASSSSASPSPFHARWLSSPWQTSSSSPSFPPHRPLRSIHYSLSLGSLPDLSSSSSWSSHLARQREDYNRQRRQVLRAPDNSLPEGVQRGSEEEERGVGKDWTVNNPLSLDDQNPWEQYRSSLELLQTIEADVSRCLPEVSLLREASVQRPLAYLLLVWSTLNPRIGYRQGMHELAGVLWVVRQADSLESREHNGTIAEDNMLMVLDEKYVEHDTYSTFDALMKRTVDFYQWRASEADSSTNTPTSPFQLPILQRCTNVSSMLKRCDPLLAAHLFSLGIEPQLFLLRWMRLLFLREFSLGATLELWDMILSPEKETEQAPLEVAEWISIALLLRMRNRLLVDDQAEAFQALLQFTQTDHADGPQAGEEVGQGSHPSNPSVAPGEAPHHTPLLYTQAVALRSAPSPQTGVQCVFQNAELLGIPITPPTRSEPSGVPAHSGRIGSTARVHPPATRKTRLTVPLSTDVIQEGLSDLARNVYSTYTYTARPDSTLFATAQRLAAAYGSTRRPNDDRGVDGGFPQKDRLEELERRRKEGERGGGIVQAQTEKQREPAAVVGNGKSNSIEWLKSRDAKMGTALNSIILGLEKDWKGNEPYSGTISDQPSPGTAQRGTRSFSTLATLRHIRDVLVGREQDFDEDVIKTTLAILEGTETAQSEKSMETASFPPRSAPVKAFTSPTVQQQQQQQQQHVVTSLPRTSLPRPPTDALSARPLPIADPSPRSPGVPLGRSHLPVPSTSPTEVAQVHSQGQVTRMAGGGGDPLGVL